MRYRPGTGLDGKKIQKSSKYFQWKHFWIIFLSILLINYQVRLFFLIRVVFHRTSSPSGPLPKKTHLVIYWQNRLKKIVLKFFYWKYFEDFWIFFQSRPVPGLYLKPFKSYSQSKTTTILNTWQNTKSLKKLFIVSLSYAITKDKLSNIFQLKWF